MKEDGSEKIYRTFQWIKMKRNHFKKLLFLSADISEDCNFRLE